MASDSTDGLDTGIIRQWRSIMTLIVFVATNIVVLFPFKLPMFVPRLLRDGMWWTLSFMRIANSRPRSRYIPKPTTYEKAQNKAQIFLDRHFIRYRFPMDFTTAPLIADLFLLATLTIGREEIYAGTVGKGNIYPLDIMAFFLTLAYIAISIDASGLIRYMAFRVLKWGGENGHRLYFYLYAFFFTCASLIGNDPIVLSGTAFLAYMVRVSSNIEHPRAWIHTQFTMANIGSAILVSSNPTNLVLAGAFDIKFIQYTANIIVPVIVTAIVVFPFLLYIAFSYEKLIPSKISMYEAPSDLGDRAPINPNIRNARIIVEEQESEASTPTQALSKQDRLSLEEILNPFLDRKGAWAGAAIMLITLVTILAINAATDSSKEHPVYWVTLPAACVMLSLDFTFGWLGRENTRRIVKSVKEAEERKAKREALLASSVVIERRMDSSLDGSPPDQLPTNIEKAAKPDDESWNCSAAEKVEINCGSDSGMSTVRTEGVPDKRHDKQHTSLESLAKDAWDWAEGTFPTVTAVFTHLPFKLIPFALCMFVLVQALSTKGWVLVFAYGWDHWVTRTGTIGAIGGMGFLSVIMCNCAGTNIGTTILLCRVIQKWVLINEHNNGIITDRTFWATVYSMALGVNYGAFSTAFSASLAGLLWRDILQRKDIIIRPLEFARVNFRIIAVAMTVGCVVLTGEVYLFRHDVPYKSTLKS